MTVPERTTRYVDYTFKDRNGTPVQPTSGRYRIDNASVGKQVRTWTNIASPQSSGTVTLTATDTVILNRANAKETIVVQIEGTYGADDLARDTIEIEIERMSGHE